MGFNKTAAFVVVAAIVMVITFAFYAFFAREVTHWMEGKHHWFHDYEPWSLLGFIFAFICATALFLPAQPFVVATGYLFGFHFLTILFTFMVYCLAAFLMFNGARYWFRPAVEQWLKEHRVVQGMAHYVQDPKEGAKVNLLFSFTPISFCLHCYVMGITEINEHIFMGTFLVGQSPHIFFGVLTGSALLAAETSNLAMDWFKIGMLAAGVLGTFVAIVYIGSVAQDILRQMDEGMSNDRLLPVESKASGAQRCGVGVTFEEADDLSLVVLRLAPSSPAANSNLIAVGDVLHEIDGKAMYKESIEHVTKAVPGPEGSIVTLGFKRGNGALFHVKLARCPAVAVAKSYGTMQTQTPPETPVEEGQVITYAHPEVVVHGGSTAIHALAPHDHQQQQQQQQQQHASEGGAPVYVTVSTGT
eukprot:CAMPEP_0181322098 /NCGR_PEP_ID=MMETSP1101-20121128/19047_1 /TAXON_ID=46948 /ORGANISM="Rhodomonas abbreviata, Strain Caron Lab Isolate" /LENGTH=415 /DNA_ID=CAMNT_0023429989 /DNA_START=209 /DNA_END=1456 /DNA_ORIENTATION=-